MQVKVDGMEVRGWMTPAKWRAELGMEQWNDEDGEEWIVEVKGGGWIEECESGRKFRIEEARLRSLSVKKDKKDKKKGKACDECGEEFRSEVSWCKACRRWQMQEDGRYVRERAEKKKGDKSDRSRQARGEGF